MITFSRKVMSTIFIGLTMVSCNQNQSEQTKSQSKNNSQTIQTKSVTSASVRANDTENGNSGMEKFATKEAKDQDSVPLLRSKAQFKQRESTFLRTSPRQLPPD